MDKYIINNKLGLKDPQALNKCERRLSALRIIELRDKSFKKYDFSTLMKIHKEIFQDIYSWAGTIRNDL